MKLWLEIADLKGLRFEEVDLITDDGDIQIIQKDKKETIYLNARHASISFYFESIGIVGFVKGFGTTLYTMKRFTLYLKKPKRSRNG